MDKRLGTTIVRRHVLAQHITKICIIFFILSKAAFIVVIVKLLLANFYWIKPQLNYNYIENEHDILYIHLQP